MVTKFKHEQTMRIVMRYSFLAILSYF